tara:strand:+ start:658 stop:894 length:237 start_codon:yes stop_codon:yes gene_type:complete
MKPKASDTIQVRDDLTVIKITKDIDEKYARKLIQQWLKKNTDFMGGWQLFHQGVDEYSHTFKVINPLREAGMKIGLYR